MYKAYAKMSIVVNVELWSAADVRGLVRELRRRLKVFTPGNRENETLVHSSTLPKVIGEHVSGDGKRTPLYKDTVYAWTDGLLDPVALAKCSHKLWDYFISEGIQPEQFKITIDIGDWPRVDTEDEVPF